MTSRPLLQTRRAWLIGAAVLAGGCRPSEPVADGEVEAGVAAFQSRRPSGPHAVALDRTWADGRDLWVWRPADQVSPLTADPLPSAYVERLQRRFGPSIGQALVEAGGHAGAAAGVDDRVSPFVVFQPGATFGSRDYRLVMEHLASHGVVVVGLNPLGSPRASAERYTQAADEFRRLLDQIPKLSADGVIPHADPTGVVLAGHSIGGAAAVLALDHPRARSAINIDGDFVGPAAKPAPDKPILYISGENPDEPASAEARRRQIWSEVSREAPHAVALRLHGMAHLDITDGAVLAAMSGKVGRGDPLSSQPALLSTLREWVLMRPESPSWSPEEAGTLLTPAFG